MKEKLIYSLIVLLFSLFILSLALFYLFNGFEIQGNTQIKKKYYDIKLNDAVIEYETNMVITVNDNKIKIKIPNLNDFQKTKSISIDVTNIGNISANVSNIFIDEIFSNINPENLSINLSLNKNDIIKGGETKKLVIDLTYNGKDKINEPCYEFSIKYVFDEVIL